MEFPQSSEVFEGIDNIRGQFADYPQMPEGHLSAAEVAADEPMYALSPNTVISVGASGRSATATLRARYPDGSLWWVVVVYDTDGERVSRSKVYFAPDFEPADWRSSIGFPWIGRVRRDSRLRKTAYLAAGAGERAFNRSVAAFALSIVFVGCTADTRQLILGRSSLQIALRNTGSGAPGLGKICGRNVTFSAPTHPHNNSPLGAPVAQRIRAADFGLSRPMRCGPSVGSRA